MSAEVKPNLVRPRWRKVLSDLWDDKTRTGLVVASIAVGVFAIGVIVSSYVILGQDINRSYAAVNPPNIEIWTDPFDEDLVQAIKNVPGVKDVEGRRMVAIRARRGNESWQSLTLVGITDFAGNIDHLDAIEGSAFPGKDQIIVSQEMLHVTGYRPGDVIEIELPDGTKRSLTVVGLVTDQTTAKTDPEAPNNGYVTMKTLSSMGVDWSFNHLFVTVAGDGSDHNLIAGVAANVKDKVKDSGREVYQMDEKLSNEHPMTSLILAVLGVLGALGGLITILSSSLIINTLNALLAQQLRQIGIMKLVGARSRQILGMYLTLIIAYSLMALALAVPLGAIGGYAMALFVARFIGAVLQGFRIVPAAVVIQILIAVAIPLAAGFFPVHGSAKTSVQEAISNYRPGRQAARRNLLSLNAQWFHWISRPILLSLRNTFRKRGRLLFTVFTLTVAGAVFIAVFNVRDSMGLLMNQIMQHFMGDVTVDLRRPYRVSEVEHILMGIPGVAGVEGWTGASGAIWDGNDNVVTNLSIVAPPQDTRLLHAEFLSGRWLLPGEKRAMVISDSIYEYYPHLKAGDTLTVKLPGQQKEQWNVVGIFRFENTHGDPIAYSNFEFIAGEIHFPNQASTYRVVAQTHDAASQQALSQRIDNVLTERNFAVRAVQSGELLRTTVTQATNTLIIFLFIMAVLTALVGSIGLTGMISINVLERTREIGVMRAIGAVDLLIMQSVIIEGLVIGLITWVLAIGLSFPISYLLLTIIGKAIMGSPLNLSFTPLGILVWLGVVIVLSAVASIIPARNAARLTINEVLAYE